MKISLIVIIICLIIINIASFIYGKRSIKKLEQGNNNSEEEYKKCIKYMIFSVILSFVTVMGISIIAVIKLIG